MKRIKNILLVPAYLTAFGAIALVPDRGYNLLIVSLYFISFLIYILLSRKENTLAGVLVAGCLARLSLFVTMPLLSDDIFRFLWDGHLLGHGINPYLYTPEEVLHAGIAEMPPGLFENLNSPRYHSIYPPLDQGLFWISQVISGEGNFLAGTNVLRIFLFAGDLLSYFLLRQLLEQQNLNANSANWFFLNPLIILEGTGNCHLEVLVILFLLLTLHAISRLNMLRAGFAQGMAIAAKMLPLILVPATWLQMKTTGSRLKLLAISLSIAAISFIPLFAANLGPASSFFLYFRKFEFNASIYFLLRELGYLLKGYNVIGTLGPALGFLSGAIILVLAVLGYKRKWKLSEVWLWTLASYLFLSTTVHPWYILPLIPLGILAGYRFPIVWSLMIFLTYLGYHENGFSLHGGWVFMEYFVVMFVVFYELKVRSNPIRTNQKML